MTSTCINEAAKGGADCNHYMSGGLSIKIHYIYIYTINSIMFIDL